MVESPDRVRFAPCQFHAPPRIKDTATPPQSTTVWPTVRVTDRSSKWPCHLPLSGSLFSTNVGSPRALTPNAAVSGRGRATRAPVRSTAWFGDAPSRCFRRDRVIRPDLAESISLNDMIRSSHERRRYRQSKRLRCFQVEDQLEFGGLLHRQFAGLGTL